MSEVMAAGGTVSGAATVTKADGTVIELILTSDPLTQEQIQQLEEIENGNNSR
jgi:hypothetical protein